MSNAQLHNTANASDPAELRASDFYKEEYVEDFVDKWDELINWDAREKGEGDFFVEALQKRGKYKVLDAATGTGYHSIKLLERGFEVTSVDGSPNMLAKAFNNGCERDLILQTVQADWRWLNRDVHSKFDAIICLGNSFTHLFSENDRRKALAEFHSALRQDGILILDQRNFSSILDRGFSTKHTYYYAGENVRAEPDYIDEGLVRFCYEFPDNSIYHLNFFPLRESYTTRLMREVGFQEVNTYGDFKETYKQDDPDYFIHIAEKQYKEQTE